MLSDTTLRKRIARRLCALEKLLRGIRYRLDPPTKPGPKRGSRRRTPQPLLEGVNAAQEAGL